MLLVAVRVGDVGEVDVERHARLEDGVHRLERLREQRRLEIGAVARRVHVGEVEHGPHPPRSATRSRRRRRASRGRARVPSPRLRTAPRAPCLRDARGACRAARRPRRSRRRASGRAGSRDGRRPPPRRTPRRSRHCGRALRRRTRTCGLLASRWPMNPKSGAWTESATSASRAASPSRFRQRVVHPEPALEVDLAGVVAALDAGSATARRGSSRAGIPGKPTRIRPICGNSMPSDGPRTLRPWISRPESTFSSSTSTSVSPTSGVRRPTSPNGISRSSRPSCAPRTARATATPSRRIAPGSLCHDHGYEIPGSAAIRARGLDAQPRGESAHGRSPGDVARRSGVSSGGGPEALPGSARHRALDRGGARSLPSLHLDRRRRDALGAAERARGADGHRLARRAGRRQADGRRARGRAPVPAA